MWSTLAKSTFFGKWPRCHNKNILNHQCYSTIQEQQQSPVPTGSCHQHYFISAWPVQEVPGKTNILKQFYKVRSVAHKVIHLSLSIVWWVFLYSFNWKLEHMLKSIFLPINEGPQIIVTFGYYWFHVISFPIPISHIIIIIIFPQEKIFK